MAVSPDLKPAASASAEPVQAGPSVHLTRREFGRALVRTGAGLLLAAVGLRSASGAPVENVSQGPVGAVENGPTAPPMSKQEKRWRADGALKLPRYNWSNFDRWLADGLKKLPSFFRR